MSKAIVAVLLAVVGGSAWYFVWPGSVDAAKQMAEPAKQTELATEHDAQAQNRAREAALKCSRSAAESVAAEQREAAESRCAHVPRPLQQTRPVIPPEQLATMDPQLVAFKEAEAEEAVNARGAVRRYMRLANDGYGPAVKRIYEIYNNGLGNVAADYAEAIKWERKCRAAGVDCGIPKKVR